jgi:hypothetical protein
MLFGKRHKESGDIRSIFISHAIRNSISENFKSDMYYSISYDSILDGGKVEQL